MGFISFMKGQGATLHSYIAALATLNSEVTARVRASSVGFDLGESRGTYVTFATLYV